MKTSKKFQPMQLAAALLIGFCVAWGGAFAAPGGIPGSAVVVAVEVGGAAVVRRPRISATLSSSIAMWTVFPSSPPTLASSP